MGLRCDPFECIPGGRSNNVATAVDYFTQTLAPSLSLSSVYKIFNVTNVYTSYYLELLAEEDFLHAGTAVLLSSMDQLQRRSKEALSATL